MLKTIPHSDVKYTSLRRISSVLTALVVTCALATFVATTFLVSKSIRQSTEESLQARATALARSVDDRLRTYSAALQTIAESHSLLAEFDLPIVEWEARRVGALFGGWFSLSRGGDNMEILMSTARGDGRLPPPEPRTNYPEVMHAEAESVRTGRIAVSDAFRGRLARELVITIVKPLEIPALHSGFIYFSVTLREITLWMEEAVLDEGEFAAIADGTRRVIARSQNNEDFELANLPRWYIDFSRGRNSGIAVGSPIHGGTARIFAMQRLNVAPGWTLAISRPMPTWYSAAYLSPWPVLSGIFILMLGGVLTGLYLDRRRTLLDAAAREALLVDVREADARKSRLIAVLAHDLRTPLVSMLGALDLFRSGVDQSERERTLNRLKTDGHGMLTLIDDVLELARLGSGEAVLRPEPFAPIELLKNVGDMIRASAERQRIKIVIHADNFPLLRGDVASLRRVLMNFATNAIKATRSGSIQISATSESVGAGGHTVVFAVTDTGCGIAAEDIPRLFRDFGKLERDLARADGTGLGLAICRRLATAMGGKVGVESKLGVGSRFWLRVTLPELEGVEAVTEPFGRAEDPTAVLFGLKVLVAEDHDTIRQLTCADLADAGMLPTEAADGIIAIELAEAEKFDLILMDLQMPRLDGDEAAALIRSGEGPSAQALIICLTAHQTPEVALMLSDLAFDAIVCKPLDIRQLAAVVQGAQPPLIAAASPKNFDRARLIHLHETAGTALLTRTFKNFAAEIETARTDLALLIAKRDTIGAGRLVHKLAGISDILGALELSADLRKFEDRIRYDDDIESLDAACELICDTIVKTRVELDQLILEMDPSSNSAAQPLAK